MVFIGEEGEGSDEDSDEDSDEGSDEGAHEGADEGAHVAEGAVDTEVSEGADHRAGCRMASEVHVVGDSVEHLFQHTARPL